MGVWFRIHSSELSSVELFEIRKVRVVEVGLEVAESGRKRIQPVIGHDDGLGVLKFGEGFHVKTVVGVGAVGLRCGEVGAMGHGPPCKQADVRIITALRKVVAGLEAVFAPAKRTSGFRGEVIRQREKHFGSEGLEQGPPRLTRQCGFERADTLGRDDRYALGLARQTEELFIAGGFALPDRGEVLVLVAEEKDLAEILFRVGFDLRDAIQDSTLEIELHHYAQGLGKSRVHPDGKVQRTYGPSFDKPTERGQWHPVTEVDVGRGIVALRGWAEGPFDGRIVIEKRKEYGDALDDGSSQFGLNATPVAVIPAFDGLELLVLVGNERAVQQVSPNAPRTEPRTRSAVPIRVLSQLRKANLDLDLVQDNRSRGRAVQSSPLHSAHTAPSVSDP